MSTVKSRRAQRLEQAPPSKGELREQAILDAAERLLHTTSLADLTIDEIARGAGLSRPSLYFYFSDKERVFAALLDRSMQQIRTALLEWLSSPELPAIDGLRESYAQIAEIWRLHGPVLRAAVENRNSMPAVAAQWDEMFNQIMDVTAQLIARERAAGRAATGHPDEHEIARLLMYMSERSLYEMSLQGAGRREWNRYVASAVTLWYRGAGLRDG